MQYKKVLNRGKTVTLEDLFNNGGPAAPPSSKPPKNLKNNLLEPQ